MLSRESLNFGTYLYRQKIFKIINSRVKSVIIGCIGHPEKATPSCYPENIDL